MKTKTKYGVCGIFMCWNIPAIVHRMLKTVFHRISWYDPWRYVGRRGDHRGWLPHGTSTTYDPLLSELDDRVGVGAWTRKVETSDGLKSQFRFDIPEVNGRCRAWSGRSTWVVDTRQFFEREGINASGLPLAGASRTLTIYNRVRFCHWGK